MFHKFSGIKLSEKPVFSEKSGFLNTRKLLFACIYNFFQRIRDIVPPDGKMILIV